jgi:hypothetical protein
MNTNNEIVTLVINEPLPPSKKLTSETHDRWLELIHAAIKELAQRQKPPYFDKAFVLGTYGFRGCRAVG